MNAEWFTLGFLTFAFLVSNVFWARVCLQLTNRVMSRNYFDVAQGDRVGMNKPMPSVVRSSEPVFDPEDVRQAEQLNSVFANI